MAEAEAMFLAGLHGPAQALGLGANLAAAEQKLMAALPAELRPQASRVSERFHLDASTWFTDMDEPAHLLALAESVWEQRRLRVRYRRWQGEVVRTLEPLGIVLKGGSWYVVATVDEQIRERIEPPEFSRSSGSRSASSDRPGSTWRPSGRRGRTSSSRACTSCAHESEHQHAG